jgi:glycosyltransferase involved in cell wall biosynthesis
MRSASILAQRDWQVRVVGMRSKGSDRARFWGPRVVVHVQERPRASLKIRYLVFAFRALLEIAWHRPDWLYVSDVLATPVGLVVNIVGHVRTVYHEHDAPDEAPRGVIDRIVFRCRRWLVRRAELCVVPSAARVVALPEKRKSADSFVVVHNMPLRSESRARAVAEGEEFRILYIGSIVPARLPLALIDAMTRLPRHVVLWLAGYETIGSPGWVDELERAARRQGVQHRLKWFGFLPFDEVPALTASCDLGLCLFRTEGTTFNEGTVASNKPFSYLGCGLPILVPDIPVWHSAFVDCGLGGACRPESPESIAEAVQWFISNPGRARQMGERGRRLILSHWNYESEFKPVVHMLEKGSQKAGELISKGRPAV